MLDQADRALRATLGRPAARRANPAGDAPVHLADEAARRHAAGLMRINHAGEVAAQGLYHGQALTARRPGIRAAMEQAAREEGDHLAWCRDRLDELGDRPSLLAPLWYAGSVAIGALAGAAGDRWSLGFMAETERQVEGHLQDHLSRLPGLLAAGWVEGRRRGPLPPLPAEGDRSRAILQQMKVDEAEHARSALDAGAAELPLPVRLLMKLTAKVMTTTAYRV